MTINLVYALLIGFLPSVIWLAFWSREDANPEPKSLLAACFFGGMLSVLAALLLEKIVIGMKYDSNLTYILLATIEEVLKFVILLTVALKASADDEPIDAAMYCITIALGFAAMENVLFIMGPFSQGNVITGLISGNMRFLGATLVHTISTACVGFAYGYAFYHSKYIKYAALIIGLVAGIAIHSAFNIAILGETSMNILKAFSWIWGAAVVMLILFEEIKAVRPKEI
jgi:RsiW-degrading membrane proteinase PrsW (M82 family)